MQQRVSQTTGDYCFNIINSLIDYKGDIARNGKRTDGQITYSKDFSPNNIRRLILSADGARIDFHIAIGGRLNRVRPFSDVDKKKLVESLYMQNYKPMLWALADRVCSSVEEVIICVNNSQGIDLGRELNFEGLLRNRVGNGDIKQAISNRYKRLAYFTIVYCDIQTLLNNEEVRACNSPLKLISETNFVKSNSNATVFKTDWYNYYGHTSAYLLDREGSPLNEHFKKVKAKVEEDKKSKAVASYKSDRLKGVTDKFDKAFKNYRGIYICAKNLSVIVATEGNNYLALDLSRLSINLGDSPDKVKEEFNKLNSNDACEEFVRKLVISSSSLYSSLAEWFFTGISKMMSMYPLATKLALSDLDRCITVPPSCTGLVESLGLTFNGVSLPDSTSNLCCYSCILFVTDVGEHSMSKYYDKATWMQNFEGGRQ